MTEKEHLLVALMLAKQQQKFQILLDALAGAGMIDYAQAVLIEESRSTDIGYASVAFQRIRDEYRRTALLVGLQIPPDDELPS